MKIFKSPIQYVVLNGRRLPRIPDAVYRLYNPNADNMHHWTANYDEANKLYAVYGWEYEGVGWYQGKGEAVSRYYNPNNGDHMYTLDSAESAALYSAGWKSEGTDFKNAPNQKPVYRLYFESTGQHMFTIDRKEVEDLLSRGWTFEGIKLYARGSRGKSFLSKAKLRAISGFSSIRSIVKDDTLSTYGTDVSVDEDGSVMAYVDGGTLYICSSGKHIVPDDCNEMFNDCRSLSSIEGLIDWDVSNVTSMRAMFRYCYALTNVDALSKWDTSSLTELGGSVDGYYGMFSGCTSLTDISGLRNWDVSNVVTMNCLFESCPISDITPVSGWKTSSLVNANDVFNRTNISNVDALRNWDVSKATILSEMFGGCKQITSLSGISGWNVNSGANMSRMFDGVPKSVTRPSWAKSNAY